MNPYISLIKPRVLWLLVLASVVGYLYAAGAVDWQKALWLAAVSVLTVAGALAFNSYWERDIDAVMTRTAKRPLPRGLVQPRKALAYALVLTGAGIALSLITLGPLVTFFVALGWFFYGVVYTVLLKRRSWLNILLGGFAGNATFLGGYVLGKGDIDATAVLLSFAIYLWIPSHIWALAYKYRDDYRKAGVPMLPAVIDERKSLMIISILNLLSAAYVMWLSVFVVGLGAGLALVAAGAAAAVFTSIYAMKKKTDDAMWRMYKASSPVLTLFLLALLIH